MTLHPFSHDPARIRILYVKINYCGGLFYSPEVKPKANSWYFLSKTYLLLDQKAHDWLPGRRKLGVFQLDPMKREKKTTWKSDFSYCLVINRSSLALHSRLGLRLNLTFMMWRKGRCGFSQSVGRRRRGAGHVWFQCLWQEKRKIWA